MKPKTITDYINMHPEDARKRLHEMYACLQKVTPGAEEGLKWGVPALSYHRILFTFAAYKHHISLNPTPSVMKAFQEELIDFETTAGSVKFPLHKPLPVTLIEKIAAYRIRESLGKDAKWM